MLPRRYLPPRFKQWMRRAACRNLGLYPDPPRRISELGHPLSLISELGLKCRGAIHVGANTGQEFESYRKAGLESVVYIEPIPEIFARLQNRVSAEPGHVAVEALCSDRGGEEVEFHIASNAGQSSSILNFGSHAKVHPSIHYVSTLRMRTRTLDSIIFGNPSVDHAPLDCLIMDVQGAEGRVIAGAGRTLAQCRFVFTELSDPGLYEGGASCDEIMEMLRAQGFLLRSLDINRFGWGNGFFVRSPLHT